MCILACYKPSISIQLTLFYKRSLKKVELMMNLSSIIVSLLGMLQQVPMA